MNLILRLAISTALLCGELTAALPARPQGFSFDASGLSNRLITPNGDGRNDGFVISFSNPADSAISGRIYDLRGAFVADMTAGPVPGTTLAWNGRSGGAAVRSGIYVYVLEGEGKSFSGTVVVIR